MCAACALVGCPASAPTTSNTADELPPPDLLEEEPNDLDSQALGVIIPGFVLGGTMSDCGEDGSFEGADVDRFTFLVEAPEQINLRLLVRGGDVDLRFYNPAGELLADEDSAGSEGEVVQFSIGPDAAYELELRCWMGDEPDWRLVFAQGGE